MNGFVYQYLVGLPIFAAGVWVGFRNGFLGTRGRPLARLVLVLGLLALFAGGQGWLQYAEMSEVEPTPYAGGFERREVLGTPLDYAIMVAYFLAILTIGSSLSEVVTHSCGVIAIGPFGCMPNRLSEAILNETMNSKDKMATEPNNKLLRAVLTDFDELPFLAIESDGSPFPQLINAKLETFCLRAERLHQRILSANSKH